MIKAVESHTARGFSDAAFFQDVCETHAAPAGIAHRAVAKLAAGDARLKKPTTVAGTLIDRDDLERLELRLQIRKGKPDRLFHAALDLETELGRVEIGRRQTRKMITDKESVVGGDDAFVENGKRRFKLRRTRGV